MLALLIGLFLPLAGFLILMSSAFFIPRRVTGWIACATVGLAFLAFASLWIQYMGGGLREETFTFYRWLPMQRVGADFALHLDTLSLLMSLIITGVGFLIHVYSIGYIEHDEDYARYFACLNFFVFAMLLLVLAANLLLLFVGWEGVGLASYLLIGYYYTRPAAATAATKAFVVNRIGDWGLLLGILLTFYLFGTTDMETVNAQAESQFAKGAFLMSLLALLYFCGAVGKSAQLPLQVWLPDAMEGPTPVSALIHAATMVTAGVYLVVRMHAVFELSPTILQLVGFVGAITALFAALSAIGQTDLKRVLAYSTVSQLGLMFLACGVTAFYAAMFHLTTHAFIKALLFLSAGNVVHMMHGATEMEKMGGLAKKLPKTNVLFLIGVLALSGIPPMAAFFSKDLILEEGYDWMQPLFYIGLIASVLTGFYLIRAYCLAFKGEPRITDKILKVVHEAPRVMLIPLFVLAVLSVIGGFMGFAWHAQPPLEHFLEEADVTLPDNGPAGFHFSLPMWISVFGALLGVGTGYYIYSRYSDLSHPIQILKKAFYFDEIYEWLFVKPLKALALFIDRVLEPSVFQGMLHMSAKVTQSVARFFQKMQSGQIRSYFAWMVVGTVLMIIYFAGSGT